MATTSNVSPYGLLGRTLGHSWSPRIHGVFGSSPYALFEREPNDVAAFIRNAPWRGINVTIPYKREAAELADVRSPRVERLGVANTLVRRDDGTIFADNTDVLGFAWMLDRFLKRHTGASARERLHGQKVIILGSGGACQAVKAALEDAGSNVVVISRAGDETYATLGERHADAVLLVNTTPVGMFPHCPASPILDETFDQLKSLVGVLDVVYNPERTGLCLMAERKGLPAESGLAMLVSQAFFASQSFLGHALDESLVEQVEEILRSQTRNVVLIGMPGSGKTSAGRRLARLCHRPFVDLDDSFVVDHGITPSECIRSQGEAIFRQMETQTAAAHASRSGLVIACGGGIVTQPRNYDYLHQNGTIVMLDRPLDQLSTNDRPLSQSRGVKALADERMPLYRSWADLTLPCTGSAQGDAIEIAKMLGIGVSVDQTAGVSDSPA